VSYGVISETRQRFEALEANNKFIGVKRVTGSFLWPKLWAVLCHSSDGRWTQLLNRELA
jgi:hypothetical protein